MIPFYKYSQKRSIISHYSWKIQYNKTYMTNSPYHSCFARRKRISRSTRKSQGSFRVQPWSRVLWLCYWVFREDDSSQTENMFLENSPDNRCCGRSKFRLLMQSFSIILFRIETAYDLATVPQHRADETNHDPESSKLIVWQRPEVT